MCTRVARFKCFFSIEAKLFSKFQRQLPYLIHIKSWIFSKKSFVKGFGKLWIVEMLSQFNWAYRLKLKNKIGLNEAHTYDRSSDSLSKR